MASEHKSSRWAKLVDKISKDKSIRAALVDRGRHRWGEGEVEPDNFWSWFYAIKAVICIKMGWEFHEREDEGEHWYDYSNGVEIGWHSGASYFSLDCWGAYGWNTVYVGQGIFSGWWATDVYDTNC